MNNISIIFIAAIFAGLIAAGCSTTTYLSLTENNKEQIEDTLKYDEQDENVGAELTLSLMKGQEINGELLSVRDSTITLSSKHPTTENELRNRTYPITTVQYDEIQKITIEGSNYVWTGLAIGVAVGTGLGLIIGSIIQGDASGYAGLITPGSGVIGFLVGAIVGPIIGYESSNEEFILQEIPPGYDMTFLKPLARYPDEEPEYLREIK